MNKLIMAVAVGAALIATIGLNANVQAQVSIWNSCYDDPNGKWHVTGACICHKSERDPQTLQYRCVQWVGSPWLCNGFNGQAVRCEAARQ